jgi:hypothetical protein
MIYSWLYILFNALSLVMVEYTGQIVRPSVILLFGSIYAILFFNGINYSKLALIYKSVKENWALCVVVNATIAVVWLCTVYSTSLAGAGSFTFIFFSVNGTIAFARAHYPHAVAQTLKKISITGSVLLIASMSIYYFEHQPDYRHFLGMLLAAIGGAVSFVYMKQTEQMIKRMKFSASQILAVRFYLSTLLCYLVFPVGSVLQMNAHQFILVSLVSMFALIVPLYVSQKSVEKVGAEVNAMVASTAPLGSGLMELLVAPHNVSLFTLAIYALYGVLNAMPHFYMFYQKRLRTQVLA